MRYKLPTILTVLLLALVLVGFSCVRNQVANSNGVANTNGNSNSDSNSNSNSNQISNQPGQNVIDLSDKNGKEIIVKVGDLLVLDLVGNIKENQTKYYQWNAKPIPSSVPEIVSLISHTNSTESPKIKEGEWVSHWELRVEKVGDFTLKFDYQGYNLNLKPKQSFEMHIISVK
ncbi:MAG: hypothetical protein WCW02_00455 [Candidatus Buchananbacteria bacterium]